MTGTLTDKKPDRIWLEPRDGADPYVGRQWCEDNQWGNEATEYVLASSLKEIREENDRLKGELARRTANPADYRYWEGRYRDEKADNERIRVKSDLADHYEEILRTVCHHLELPQSESGPADDLTLYDRALESEDVMYRKTEAERVEHMNARYRAEASCEALAKALEPFAKAGRVIDGPFGPALFAKDDMAFQSGCAWSENGERKTITWGDFRTARGALDAAARNKQGSNGETLEKVCLSDPNNDPKNENIAATQMNAQAVVSVPKAETTARSHPVALRGFHPNDLGEA